jgi:hypothetical protein
MKQIDFPRPYLNWVGRDESLTSRMFGRVEPVPDNWLTRERAKELLASGTDRSTLKGNRDHAIMQCPESDILYDPWECRSDKSGCISLLFLQR